MTDRTMPEPGPDNAFIAWARIDAEINRIWAERNEYIASHFRRSYGPAWPDVRARMADVLAPAEEMTR